MHYYCSIAHHLGLDLTSSTSNDGPLPPLAPGKPFKLFVRFMESSLFGIVRGKLLRDNGFTQVLG